MRQYRALAVSVILAGASLLTGCADKAKDCDVTGTCPPANAGNAGTCQQSADCTSAGASRCVSGTCTACASDEDCTHISGKGICKIENHDAGTTAGICVQCTGTDYEACSGDAGVYYVCNSLTNTCSTKVEHTADLCQPCVSDAQCKPGRLCVEQKFGTLSVGYFCFFKQGDTANGAPADCTTAQPYVSGIAATSIDGEFAQICALRASTCIAMNQYSQTSCASSTGTPDNSLCGASAGVDSECTAYGASQYLCTVACGGNVDCPILGATSMTCSTTSGTRKYCSLGTQ